MKGVDHYIDIFNKRHWTLASAAGPEYRELTRTKARVQISQWF